MARRSRQAPLDPRRREQERVHTIAELRDRAATEIRSLITGEDWAAWLCLAARFPGLGFTNVLLIAAHRPGATLVAGYQAWQAQGRQIRKVSRVPRSSLSPAHHPANPAPPRPREPARLTGLGSPAARNASRTCGTSRRPTGLPVLTCRGRYLPLEGCRLDSGTP